MAGADHFDGACPTCDVDELLAGEWRALVLDQERRAAFAYYKLLRIGELINALPRNAMADKLRIAIEVALGQVLAGCAALSDQLGADTVENCNILLRSLTDGPDKFRASVDAELQAHSKTYIPKDRRPTGAPPQKRRH